MKIENKPVNFEDARGQIRDIFPTGAPDCVTMITSKAGAVRGNHLHKLSTQYAFLVSGRMWAFSRMDGDEKVDRHEFLPGDLLTHVPNEAHAYVAEVDSIFLAFAEGLRKGEDYEKDTHRVASLVDAWNAQNSV